MALRQRAAKKTALPLGADDNDDVDWKPALPSMRKRTRLKVGGQNLWTRVYLPVMWGIILLVGCTHFFLGGHKAVPYDRHLSSRKLMSQHDIDTGSFDKLHQQRKELDLQKEQFVRERKKEEEYFKQERERLRMEKIKQKEELERELKDLGKKEKKKVGGLAIPSNNRYVSKEQLADNQYHPSSEIDHANTGKNRMQHY